MFAISILLLVTKSASEYILVIFSYSFPILTLYEVGLSLPHLKYILLAMKTHMHHANMNNIIK